MGTKVEEARNKCHEDHMAGTRAKEAKEPKTTKKMPGKTPKRPPKGRKAAQSSSDEDNDEAEDSFHSDQEEVHISGTIWGQFWVFSGQCTLLVLIDFCPVQSEFLTWSFAYKNL